MNYIAHCDGEREQSILEHLQGTAEKAKDFAEVFEKGDWGYCCGMLHDIGKYSDKFQRRIRGEEIKVDHATAGARVCMELGGMYPFLEMCIAGHHAGLSDYGVSTDTGNSSTTLGRRKKKIEDFYAYKKEVKIPELKTSPVNVEKTKDLNFSLSMFTRMMYSCLVDADFLDTEEFMTEERSGRQQGQEIQVLLDKLEKYITEWLKNTETESVNGRRTEILKACLENGEREKGLFRLTVPTGGGKTVASLAFALRHAVKHHMKRIIYVIPYTSIIEQNAAVFRRILGDENVLENHCNIDYEEAEVYSIRITVNSIRNDGTTRKEPGNDGKPRKIKGFSELMKRGGTRIDMFFEKRAHFSEQKEKLSTLSTKRAGKPHKQRVPGSFLNWNE